MDPDAFAAVDRVYRASMSAFAILADTSAASVTGVLAGMVGDCSVPSEVLTVFRGAQAALFTRGLLLGVNVGPAQDAVRDHAHRPLNGSEVTALRAYREPWVGVVAVLRNLGLEFANTRRIRLRNVDEEGRCTSKGLDREPTHAARVLFRAQRNVRLLEGAGPDDRFLPQSSHHVT